MRQNLILGSIYFIFAALSAAFGINILASSYKQRRLHKIPNINISAENENGSMQMEDVLALMQNENKDAVIDLGNKDEEDNENEIEDEKEEKNGEKKKKKYVSDDFKPCKPSVSIVVEFIVLL